MNISLGDTNLNNIKGRFPMCSSLTTTRIGFIDVSGGVILDLADNPLSIIDTVYTAAQAIE